MNDEQHLREILSAAVPEPPGSSDRATLARVYAATRRRRRIGVGATAAAVLAALVVPFTLVDRTGEPAEQEPTVEPGSVDCPPVRHWRTQPNPPLEGADTLEPGAVAVRLCNPYGAYWQAPADALVTDVDRMIELVNALEFEARQPRDRVCNVMGSTFNWEMQFQYADGETRLVRGSPAGCGYVEIGGAQRVGAGKAADRFIKLLGEQRSAMEPPANLDIPLPCPNYSTDTGNEFSVMPAPLPIELHEAVVCWQRELHTELPSARASTTDAQLRTLLNDLNTRAARNDPARAEECTDPSLPRIELIGTGPWGDRIHLRADCWVFSFGDSEEWTWRPGPAARELLDELVETHPQPIPLPGPDVAADVTVSTWVDLVNSGQRERGERLWVTPPDLPAEFDQIAFKGEELQKVTPEPGAPESAYTQVMENLALYRVVPTGGGYGDYHQVRFILVRNNSDQPWRILSMTDLGAVSTGR